MGNNGIRVSIEKFLDFEKTKAFSSKLLNTLAGHPEIQFSTQRKSPQ